ncbi:MAG: quinolinate synthase NadA [Thermoplasmata archaeon]|nr:quinolinate synthase NadA [Thermoplasmata archaeon]
MPIQTEVKNWKKKRKAVILAHNYQRPEVQDIADHLGDSLALSIKATQTDAEVIVFCGVDFMAESAKVLNPEKIVLHPNLAAKCPMAAMMDVDGLKELKQEHPGAVVVGYVNTSAECKTEIDICCTSSNAVKIVNKVPEKKIIFVPDSNLGLYVQRFVKDKEIIFYPGYCPTHVEIRKEDLLALKQEHPDAETMVHPECSPDVVDVADFTLSTEGMVRHVKESTKKSFIVGTERNMIYRLRKEIPGKNYIEVPAAICPNMREISLQDVLIGLQTLQPEITLSDETIRRAKIPLERMIEAGRGD